MAGCCWTLRICPRSCWIETELHALLPLDLDRGKIGRLDPIEAIRHAHCCSRARRRTTLLLQVRRLAVFANPCLSPAAHVEAPIGDVMSPPHADVSTFGLGRKLQKESEVEKERSRQTRGQGVADICLGICSEARMFRLRSVVVQAEADS